jgi:hypothetical protein
MPARFKINIDSQIDDAAASAWTSYDRSPMSTLTLAFSIGTP